MDLFLLFIIFSFKVVIKHVRTACLRILGKDRQIPKKKQIKWQLQIQRKFKEPQTAKRQSFAEIQ